MLPYDIKEEKLRGRPGYEHLNEPLHILIEADLPANNVDLRLRQAQEIIEELLKPVVSTTIPVTDFLRKYYVLGLCLLVHMDNVESESGFKPST